MLDAYGVTSTTYFVANVARFSNTANTVKDHLISHLGTRNSKLVKYSKLAKLARLARPVRLVRLETRRIGKTRETRKTRRAG